MRHKTSKIPPNYAVPCSSFSGIKLEQWVKLRSTPRQAGCPTSFLMYCAISYKRNSAACHNPYYTVCIADLLNCKSRHGLRCCRGHQSIGICAKGTQASRSLPTSTASCCMSSLYSRGEHLPFLTRYLIPPTISADLICAALMLAVQPGRD